MIQRRTKLPLNATKGFRKRKITFSRCPIKSLAIHAHDKAVRKLQKQQTCRGDCSQKNVEFYFRLLIYNLKLSSLLDNARKFTDRNHSLYIHSKSARKANETCFMKPNLIIMGSRFLNRKKK